MIKKRVLSLFAIIVITLFIILINYFMTILTRNEIEVKSTSVNIFEEKILQYYENLPEFYKIRDNSLYNSTDAFINNLKIRTNSNNIENLWLQANADIHRGQLFNPNNVNLGNYLNALHETKIINAELDTRGTQLKFLLTLEGEQTVIFKPKWYDKTRIIEGPVYAGKDRYNAEIIAFYLSGILHKPYVPLSVSRTVHVNSEILPVATSALLKTYYLYKNKTCIYGQCYYCKKEDPICENSTGHISGVVIFNVGIVMKSYRSPWQRTYKKSKKALWETQENFCNNLIGKLSQHHIYELIDTAIFDFLMQNGDRHHYEMFANKVVWIDNGKGLGNPYIHHLDILAPLYQCCIWRPATLQRLLSLRGGLLKEKLSSIPHIFTLVTTDQLDAIEKRLLLVYATVEYCKNK